MEKRIADKYAKLSKACHRYPEIVLSNVKEQNGYSNHSKNGKMYAPLPEEQEKDL